MDQLPVKLPLLLSALPLLAFAKLIITIAYNIFFHPLKKYPGPKSAAATNLTYWLISCQGNIVTWTQKQHEKYGEVVRVGPDRLSYIDPQAWKDIYGHRTAKRQENGKDSRSYSKAYNGVHSILTIPDNREHGAVRKIFSHAFSEKALKLQEPLVQKYVDKLIFKMHGEVEANPDVQLPMVMLYNCTTFDVMGELAFGEPLGLLEKSEYTPWVKTVFAGIKAGQFLRVGLEYPFLGRLIDILMPKSIKETRKQHFEYSVERVNRRLEKGTDKPDIWNLVMTHVEGELSAGQMHANASIFMAAGTETTATLLSGFLSHIQAGLTYLLLQNPEKMEKVVKEIRNLTEEELSLETLPRLPYLSASFEEGLRWYPPAPSSFFRKVPEGGNAICGQWVPAETRVAIPQWSMFHSPLNFKDPDSFIPERWLPDTGYDSDRKEALQPFSFGPRNCIGKNLAYHEMRLILAKVLWNFDLKLCPQSMSWNDQACYIIWEKPELWVEAKPVR